MPWERPAAPVHGECNAKHCLCPAVQGLRCVQQSVKTITIQHVTQVEALIAAVACGFLHPFCSGKLLREVAFTRGCAAGFEKKVMTWRMALMPAHISDFVHDGRRNARELSAFLLMRKPCIGHSSRRPREATCDCWAVRQPNTAIIYLQGATANMHGTR